MTEEQIQLASEVNGSFLLSEEEEDHNIWMLLFLNRMEYLQLLFFDFRTLIFSSLTSPGF